MGRRRIAILSPELALALIRWVDFAIGSLQIGASLKDNARRNIGRIKELVEAGEDATEEEIAAELALSEKLTTSAEAVLEQRRAAAGLPPAE